MSTVLEKIGAAQTASQLAAKQRYAALVAQLATGDKSASQVEVTAILNEVGKSADDAMRDVATRIHRNTLRATIVAANEVNPQERESLNATIAAADAKLRQAEVEHASAVQPARTRLMALRQAEHDAQAARRALIESCDDESLRAEIAAIERELAKVVEAQRLPSDHADSLEADLRNLLTSCAQRQTKPDAEHVAHIRGIIARRRAEVTALREKQAALVSRQETLVDQMLL